jgi:hypothetical protein
MNAKQVVSIITTTITLVGAVLEVIKESKK